MHSADSSVDVRISKTVLRARNSELGIVDSWLDNSFHRPSSEQLHTIVLNAVKAYKRR